jgi:hypothetical protein
VKEGLLDPVNNVDNCQLLFACTFGMMLGFLRHVGLLFLCLL